MYERMLDKKCEPSVSQIREYIGEEEYQLLLSFEKHLAQKYHLLKEIRFPFGNNYGWGYKYSHNSIHLCYAFFERSAFTVMIQVGSSQVPKLQEILDTLSKKAVEMWENRYPCGETGGWIHYRVLSKEDVDEILKFVYAKKSPIQEK